MPEKKPSDYRAAWDSLKFRAVALQADTTARGLPPGDPKVQADEAAVAALNAQKDAVAHKAWLTTARDLADPALLAEIAFDQFWDIATFPQFPADSGDRDNQEVAVAYLVRGIADAAQAQQAGTQGEGAMANEPHSPAPARPEPARAAPGNSERRIVFELEDLIGRARNGVTALHSLWGSRCGAPHAFPDQRFAASLRFCIDALGGLLEQAGWRRRIGRHLQGRRLRLHPEKTFIAPTWAAATFLGFELHADGRRRLPEDNVRRFRNRLRGLRDRWRAGTVGIGDVDARVRAWMAHAGNADTWRLRHAIFRGRRFDLARRPQKPGRPPVAVSFAAVPGTTLHRTSARRTATGTPPTTGTTTSASVS